MKIIFLTILLLATVKTIAQPTFHQIYQADLPIKAQKISYKDDGHIKELTTSSWTDKVKTDIGRKSYKYEQGFNYAKKQGFLKTYDMSGKLVKENWGATIDGGVSQEESLIAMKIFKQNSLVKKQLSVTDKELVVFTGFNFKDESKCLPGNRCVHVFASSPDISVLAHSIVRLTDLSVPYPDYDMEVSYNKHSKLKQVSK